MSHIITSELIGTTWERDGLKRTVTFILNFNIYWKRLGGKERKRPTSLSDFKRWLAKAKQVES